MTPTSTTTATIAENFQSTNGWHATHRLGSDHWMLIEAVLVTHPITTKDAYLLLGYLSDDKGTEARGFIFPKFYDSLGFDLRATRLTHAAAIAVHNERECVFTDLHAAIQTTRLTTRSYDTTRRWPAPKICAVARTLAILHLRNASKMLDDSVGMEPSFVEVAPHKMGGCISRVV